uniref:Uncharacterized protein n=1 Tax=Zea mays TaxID=4577 RepID=A0A804LQ66_MAIZE
MEGPAAPAVRAINASPAVRRPSMEGRAAHSLPATPAVPVAPSKLRASSSAPRPSRRRVRPLPHRRNPHGLRPVSPPRLPRMRSSLPQSPPPQLRSPPSLSILVTPSDDPLSSAPTRRPTLALHGRPWKVRPLRGGPDDKGLQLARGARLREDLRGSLRQPRERQDVEAGGGRGVVGGEDLRRDVRQPPFPVPLPHLRRPPRMYQKIFLLPSPPRVEATIHSAPPPPVGFCSSDPDVRSRVAARGSRVSLEAAAAAGTGADGALGDAGALGLHQRHTQLPQQGAGAPPRREWTPYFTHSFSALDQEDYSQVR